MLLSLEPSIDIVGHEGPMLRAEGADLPLTAGFKSAPGPSTFCMGSGTIGWSPGGGALYTSRIADVQGGAARTLYALHTAHVDECVYWLIGNSIWKTHISCARLCSRVQYEHPPGTRCQR